MSYSDEQVSFLFVGPATADAGTVQVPMSIACSTLEGGESDAGPDKSMLVTAARSPLAPVIGLGAAQRARHQHLIANRPINLSKHRQLLVASLHGRAKPRPHACRPSAVELEGGTIPHDDLTWIWATLG